MYVAPFTGAWIEIPTRLDEVVDTAVAPFTGAWIEIIWVEQKQSDRNVAPFTGAWIEMSRLIWQLAM